MVAPGLQSKLGEESPDTRESRDQVTPGVEDFESLAGNLQQKRYRPAPFSEAKPNVKWCRVRVKW